MLVRMPVIVLGDRFVVMHSGNVGLSQSLELVVAAAVTAGLRAI